MKRLCLVLILCLMLTVTALRAQDTAPTMPRFAFQSNDLLMVRNSGDIPDSVDALFTGILGLTESGRSNFFAAWSPDGSKLAFVEDGNLIVYDVDNLNRVNVAPVDGFDEDAGLSWTKDGRIVYAVITYLDETNLKTNISVNTIAPEAGAVPQVVMSDIPIDFNCGIGTIDPREGTVWGENGVTGTAGIVAVTDYGVIYPGSCSGYQMSLTRPDGETVAFAGGRLTNTVLSPDESQLAGITYDNEANVFKIVVVDLATLAETTLTTTASPSIVAWGDNGDFYYGTVTQTHSLLDRLTPEQQNTVSALLGDTMHAGIMGANVVYLYRHAADGTDTLLTARDAYSMTRLVLKDNYLVFSLVSNGDKWVDAMMNGELTSDPLFESAWQYIPVTVYVLPLKADGSAGQIITLPGDLRHVTVAP